MPIPSPHSAHRHFRLLSHLFRLLLAVATLAAMVPAQAQGLNLVQAAAVQSDAAVFPVGADARMQPLPDDWSLSRPDYSGVVWYRVRFDADASLRDQALGLYLRRACSGYRLVLNGVRLPGTAGQAGLPSSPCYGAQVVEVPVGLLQAQNNVLDIKVDGLALQRVNAARRAGGLSALELGPLEALLERQQNNNFWRLVLPALLSAMLIGMAVFAAVYASVSKQERYLGYLAGMALVSALLSLRIFVPDKVLASATAEWLMASLAPLLLLCVVQFLLRHLHWRHRALDIALALQCVLAPLSLWWAGATQHHALAGAWFLTLGTQALAAGVFSLWLTWHSRREEFWPMATLLGLAAAMLALELLSQHRALPESARVLALAGPLSLLLIGLRLVVVHARDRNRYELERSGLEQRIRDTVSEIERNYAQLAEAKVEQVTERERKRIAADLHDDLGAKLLTIVHTSESDRISTLAREALEEMRLSVRGLTGKPVQLLDALGDWRAEVVSRLGQANIKAEWRVPSEDLAHTLPARAYVQTTRIVREAVSNIIKHSGATHCTVNCAVLGTDFQIMIQDNGQGISLELDGRLDRGHGMASMKSRAKQMHGQCLVESGPGWGTVIRLTIPL